MDFFKLERALVNNREFEMGVERATIDKLAYRYLLASRRTVAPSSEYA